MQYCPSWPQCGDIVACCPQCMMCECLSSPRGLTLARMMYAREVYLSARIFPPSIIHTWILRGGLVVRGRIIFPSSSLCRGDGGRPPKRHIAYVMRHTMHEERDEIKPPSFLPSRIIWDFSPSLVQDAWEWAFLSSSHKSGFSPCLDTFPASGPRQKYSSGSC